MTSLFRSFATISALATLCIEASAAAPQSVGALDPATRPAGVPSNYVVTPNGFFHPSCVIELGGDDTLTASGDIVHGGDRVTPAAACAYPHYGARGQLVTQAMHPDYDGWIVASQSDYTITPSASVMDSDFVVPSGPTSQVGQVLYFFPGLVDGQNENTILQPVLAWDGFGDNAWTMTNWNCCNSGSTFHGPSIPVSTGDKIKGTMVGSHCSGDICANWKIGSTDLATGAGTVFKTSGFGQAFDWYFGGVLEAYGVSACTTFPSNGSIAFTKDKVLDMNGENSTPDWILYTVNGIPSCNFKMTSTSPKNTTLSWSTK